MNLYILILKPSVAVSLLANSYDELGGLCTGHGRSGLAGFKALYNHLSVATVWSSTVTLNDVPSIYIDGSTLVCPPTAT